MNTVITSPAPRRTAEPGRAPLAVLLSGTFLVVLDFFIVNVALPSVQHAPEVRWAVERLGRWRSEHGEIVGFEAAFADPYRDLDRSVRENVYVKTTRA